MDKLVINTNKKARTGTNPLLVIVDENSAVGYS